MRSHTLSMSKVHLAVLCAHSFRGDVNVTPRPSGIEARKGTAAHKIVECWFHETEPPEYPEDIASDAKRFAASAIRWLEPQRERILACEIGVRYDADADRAVVGPKRDEPGYDDHPPMVLKGTLDLVMRGVDGVLEVLDIKTGKKDNAHNEQIVSQGLAVARLYGEKRVRVGFLFPRLTKCDDPEWIELGENALDMHAGDMHELLSGLPTSEPKPGDGKHCFRCDYRGDCPAFNETRDEQEMEQRIAAGVL